MADYQEFSSKMKETLDLAAQSFEAENGAGYGMLGEQLEELETMAQQIFQDHEDCKSIAKKLESGAQLTPDELNTLKLFVVGDADYFTKYDDNLDRNKAELKRLLDEIRGMQLGELDADKMMHLGVLCKEAASVAKPTAFYFDQKERVQQFENATRDGIDREKGKILADIIRGI
jgi:hypothetical protein